MVSSSFPPTTSSAPGAGSARSRDPYWNKSPTDGGVPDGESPGSIPLPLQAFHLLSQACDVRALPDQPQYVPHRQSAGVERQLQPQIFVGLHIQNPPEILGRPTSPRSLLKEEENWTYSALPLCEGSNSAVQIAAPTTELAPSCSGNYEELDMYRRGQRRSALRGHEEAPRFEYWIVAND